MRFANVTKASKLLGPDSTALMEKTIPAPQWTGGPFWRQYPQTGAVCMEICQECASRKQGMRNTDIIDCDPELRELGIVGTDRHAGGVLFLVLL
jgi:hypothetical protein